MHAAPENEVRYRDRMPSFAAAVALGSAMTDPDKAGSDNGVLIVVVAILAIVGLCLWLFFRRGSINHRADVDMPIDDRPPPTSSDGSGDEPDRSSI